MYAVVDNLCCDDISVVSQISAGWENGRSGRNGKRGEWEEWEEGRVGGMGGVGKGGRVGGEVVGNKA